MNTEAMLKLADFLESLPNSDMFLMDTWFGKFDYSPVNGEINMLYLNGSEVDDIDIKDPLAIYDCKTAGCIAGWAIISNGEIQNFKKTDHNANDCFEEYCDICYEEETDTPDHIAAQILDISIKDANKLFYTSGRSNLWWRYREEFDSHYITRSHYSYTNDGKHMTFYNRVDSSLITNKDAAQMLRGLATGLYSFDEVDTLEDVRRPEDESTEL